MNQFLLKWREVLFNIDIKENISFKLIYTNLCSLNKENIYRYFLGRKMFKMYK